MLAVEVACSQPQDRRAKRNLTGVFQHWDCMDPAWNPGGLWRGVRIERTGPVRINRMRVLCRDAEPERANVMVRAELDSDEARTVRIRTTVDDAVERELEQSLAAGTNVVLWSRVYPNPRESDLYSPTSSTCRWSSKGEDAITDAVTFRHAHDGESAGAFAVKRMS